MPQVTLYHNPRCSKSRAALALLEARGIQPRLRLYLEQPLSKTELKKLLRLLDMRARELLQRPIAVVDDEAVIGGPPEKILELLP